MGCGSCFVGDVTLAVVCNGVAQWSGWGERADVWRGPCALARGAVDGTLGIGSGLVCVVGGRSIGLPPRGGVALVHLGLGA